MEISGNKLKFNIGDKVKKSYRDDETIYEIDQIKYHQKRWIYHLKEWQGWKAEVNLMGVKYMTYEIVITVLDERIAELCKENIEHKTGYNCEIRRG